MEYYNLEKEMKLRNNINVRFFIPNMFVFYSEQSSDI